MRVTIYSKPGCHLCDDMKAVVTRVLAGMPGAALEEIDIGGDPALMARYATDIPVLEIDGRKVAKYRVTENELRRRLGLSLS